MSQQRQIVLDTETTGLEPAEGHRIIEIGCVELINRRLTENRFHQYLNPDREIDAAAFEVHGISTAMLADKPRFRDVANDLLEFVRGAEVIIHNAPFDLGFLNHEFRLIAPPASPTPSRTPGPTEAPTPAPTLPSGVSEVIRKGNTARRAVTFTFDAGSDAGYTSQILDTLAANGITAQFGITGKWAEGNPALVERMAGDGHGFINHSYDHASFTGLSTGKTPLTTEARWAQLDQTESIVSQLTGRTTLPFFRPPYGDYDYSVNVDIGARGYRYNVMWTVDSGGWRGMSAGEIRQRCLDGAEPGAIYVFHVGSGSQDGPALQSIIDDLRADGYQIITLPALLAL